jgi:hypothetical protein
MLWCLALIVGVLLSVPAVRGWQRRRQIVRARAASSSTRTMPPVTE